MLRALHELPEGVSVSGRDLARRAGVSNPTVLSVVGDLTGLGLVAARRTPHMTLYELNYRHALAPALGALFGREAGLRQQLLAWLRTQLQRLEPPIDRAFLFGSQARHPSVDPTRDVDVAVVCGAGEEVAVEAAAADLTEEARRRFGVRLDLLVGAPSLADLTAADRPGRDLWQRIRRDGVPLLGPGDLGFTPK